MAISPSWPIPGICALTTSISGPAMMTKWSPMMALGAKGVISVASNIIPEVMVQMSHWCLDNDFESAAKLQIEYMDLIDALFCEVNPIPVKAAMNLMGMEAGSLRLPLCDISDKNLAVLRTSMERMGLLK